MCCTGIPLQALQEKRDSTIPTKALSCRPDGDGGRLCGIPIGYKGFPGRNGYYYMPKVSIQCLGFLKVQIWFFSALCGIPVGYHGFPGRNAYHCMPMVGSS